MNEPKLELAGLDAANPLGYFAALGLLQVLSDLNAVSEVRCEWRLSWRNEGRWLAVLHGTDDSEFVINRLQSDVASWRNELALQLAYDQDGKRIASTDVEALFDLKPTPEAFREFVDEVADNCTPTNMRSARMVAAYGSELITDNKGKLKPTGLHFTAGKQAFLGMVRALQQGLTSNDFREALLGPWRTASTLPSLSWNASAPRIYAYRAVNPSDEKRGSVPAADWLAFVALRFFPVAGKGSRLITTGIKGGWKDSTMRWPVWDAPLTLQTIRSLQTWPGLRTESMQANKTAAGIKAVYEAAILRSDQGGYGSFTPARIV